MFGGFRKRKKTFDERAMNIIDIANISTRENIEKSVNYLAKKLFKTHQKIINELSLEENTLIPTKHKIWAHNWIAKDETDTIYNDYIESMKETVLKKYTIKK